MGRKLLTARFTVGAGTLQVSTVHLESSAAGEQCRMGQLRWITERLRSESSDCTVLCGDMNFGVDSPENKLLEGFGDAWAAAGEGEGHTVGVNYPSESHRTQRFDRIMIRGAQVEQIELIGDQPIALDDVAIVEEEEDEELPAALRALMGGKGPAKTGRGIDVGQVEQHAAGIVFPSDHLGLCALINWPL
eukprot:TRINITY_DN24126_c0_g1_i3.p1 TRINITY_DN24126_c0_g1~~TRINITY_DN24126_c0_g1_i3.p1  ORF type:complete len:190 (-),score=32.18 TRINITY_DN24126_c0_g1_i3:52-621(-)